MLDTINRDIIRDANNNLVKRADEIWVFGPISDGVLAEIKLAQSLKKPIRYFEILNSKNINEITKEKAVFEDDIEISDRQI